MWGLWVAAASVRGLIRAYPSSLPRTSEVGIDVPVLCLSSDGWFTIAENRPA